MAKRRGQGEGRTTIVIRRIEETGTVHHSGAWKVAYADFVTAMMAFFLLMWLINATSEKQRRGIAAYFSPMADVENGFSNAGLVPGGLSPLDKGTNLVVKASGAPPSSDAPQPMPQTAPGQATSDDPSSSGAADNDTDGESAGPGGALVPATAQAASQGAAAGIMHDQAGPASAPATDPASAARLAVAIAERSAAAAVEEKSLTIAAVRVRRLVAADPALTGFSDQMAIDVTPEGLRIQIMDSESKPMFDRGATTLNPRAQALLRKVAPFLATLPESISVEGYSDGAPLSAGAVSNWTLSAGRANAARDLLTEAGLPEGRIANVTGFADRHLLLPADPFASANRRIVLTLRRQVDAAKSVPAGG